MSGPSPRDPSGGAKPITVRLPPRVLDALGATPTERRAALLLLADLGAILREHQWHLMVDDGGRPCVMTRMGGGWTSDDGSIVGAVRAALAATPAAHPGSASEAPRR